MGNIDTTPANSIVLSANNPQPVAIQNQREVGEISTEDLIPCVGLLCVIASTVTDWETMIGMEWNANCCCFTWSCLYCKPPKVVDRHDKCMKLCKVDIGGKHTTSNCNTELQVCCVDIRGALCMNGQNHDEIPCLLNCCYLNMYTNYGRKFACCSPLAKLVVTADP